jgi:hypothetical protein
MSNIRDKEVEAATLEPSKDNGFNPYDTGSLFKWSVVDYLSSAPKREHPGRECGPEEDD